jgi:hypothetical protein
MIGEVPMILTEAVIRGVMVAVKEKDLSLGVSAFGRSVKVSMSRRYYELNEGQYDRLMEARELAARHGPMDGVGE